VGAFLATPIPEPATWLLFGSTLVGLTCWSEDHPLPDFACFFQRAVAAFRARA
jgi:hypothetical protein